MRHESFSRAAAVLILAFLVPACHDDDDDDDGAGGGGAVESRTVNAVLSGGQENPPVATGGGGTATVTVAADGRSITFVLETFALSDVTGAHIHPGTPGVNGPIMFVLAPGIFASPASGTLTEADFQPVGGITTFAEATAAILEGRTYVNVHTQQNPDGEIRGHLGPARFQAPLSSEEEVPPNASGGTGVSTVDLNAEQTEIAFTLEFAGLGSEATAAHIHVGPPGENGPIIFTLAMAPLTGPVSGTLTAANLEPRPAQGVNTFADAVDALLRGNAYVNVHSNTFPNGEIRGQLIPAP